MLLSSRSRRSAESGVFVRLDEFEQTRVGEVIRYTAALTDDRGEQAYQLLLVGDEKGINEVFGESDFDATISPDVDKDEWMARAGKRPASPISSFHRTHSMTSLSCSKSHVRSRRPRTPSFAPSVESGREAPASPCSYRSSFPPEGLCSSCSRQRSPAQPRCSQ